MLGANGASRSIRAWNFCAVWYLWNCLAGVIPMSVVAQTFADIESKPAKPCKCGRPYDLIRSMLNVRTGRHVRMFECNSCGDRTWDE